MQKIDLKSFSAKDAKIISANPDATPYELLGLGLSQKAYERIQSGDVQPVVEDQPSSVEQVTAPAQPETEPAAVPGDQPPVPEEEPQPGPLLPSSVEQVTAPAQPGPAKPKLSPANQSQAVAQNGTVLVRNIATQETFSTTLYFAKMAIRDGKHEIVENGKG